MHTLTRILAVVALLCGGACQAQPPLERINKATFKIETGVGQCSGTAVGPHVLLTASHCVWDGLRMVDIGGNVVEVLSITRDGEDAVLLRVKHRFSSWMRIRRAPLRQGEDVFVVGNPNGLERMFRKGYVVGRMTLPTPQAFTREVKPMDTILMELEATGGDSGGGIFDGNGNIACVLSGGYVLREDFFRLTRCHPFKFTAEQWKATSQ